MRTSVTSPRDADPLRDNTTALGHWRAVNARRWIDGDGRQLTFSDRAEFDKWLAIVVEPGWSPTRPALRYPSLSAAEELAIALVYLDALTGPGSTTTVTGDAPEVSSLWLAPGEVEQADRVY